MVAFSGRTVDAELWLKDAGALTASAACQVEGAAAVIDVGDAKVMGEIVIEVTALEIASNSEIYDIVLQGSPDANFGTDTNIQDIVGITLSAARAKRTDSDKDDVTGSYRIPFSNEYAGTVYRYLRLYCVIAGDIATGINFTARLALGHAR